ncbi:MAG TPA: DpnI domain-containing protein [Phycisphaerae bacterium]|nr:DpnI domain-containing protein [Phycisphaerae bacterium]
MRLDLEPGLAARYQSKCQIARVVTEAWAARELFCVACTSSHLTQTAANTRSVDFRCGNCNAPYQLKAMARWNIARIVDGSYQAMIASIRTTNVPNLVLMQYSTDWLVKNLLIIPSFFFTESAIQKRTPLSSTARRAGWTGCNILLSAIPQDGKIALVREGDISGSESVRIAYNRARPLSQLEPQVRGWALDVLNAVRELKTKRFTLVDAYRAEEHLQKLHPRNANVQAKIRQQLQILRDMKFLRFLGRGVYELE